MSTASKVFLEVVTCVIGNLMTANWTRSRIAQEKPPRHYLDEASYRHAFERFAYPEEVGYWGGKSHPSREQHCSLHVRHEDLTGIRRKCGGGASWLSASWLWRQCGQFPQFLPPGPSPPGRVVCPLSVRHKNTFHCCPGCERAYYTLICALHVPRDKGHWPETAQHRHVVQPAVILHKSYLISWKQHGWREGSRYLPATITEYQISLSLLSMRSACSSH